MKERKVTDIVEKFESKFYSNINNLTLEELATDYGITFSGRESVEQLVAKIGNDFVFELFQHEPFRDLPILGVHRHEEDVYMLLEAVDSGVCCDCNKELIVYAGVLLTFDMHLYFGYFAIPAEEIVPVREYRVRDVIKDVEPAWKRNPLL